MLFLNNYIEYSKCSEALIYLLYRHVYICLEKYLLNVLGKVVDEDLDENFLSPGIKMQFRHKYDFQTTAFEW